MTFNEKLNYSVIKRTRIIITLALLSMLTISVYSTSSSLKANAFDLSGIGSDNGLSGLDMGNICFASDCTNQNIKDNQNSPVVTDSDNTNIESGEGDLNHGTNPGVGSEDGTGTLSVEIQTNCEGIDNICDTAMKLTQFPTFEDYSFVVSGNNPNPSNFTGSITNTIVELGAGEFTITVTLPNLLSLSEALTDRTGVALVAVQEPVFGGDCKQINSSLVLTGTMSAGDSQSCNLLNILTIEPVG